MDLFNIKRMARVRRLLLVLSIGLGTGLAVALVLYALKQNINLFYTPTQIYQREAPQKLRIRIGGIVKPKSLFRGSDLQISFLLSDLNQEILVHYAGILPDLFREGQGVVALGVLIEQPNGEFLFKADEILAKHDENYMPPEVKGSLKNPLPQAVQKTLTIQGE